MINIIFLFVSLIFTVNTALASEPKADSSKIKITLPPEYEFVSVIKNHYASVDDYIKLLRLESPADAHPYGLALAKLNIGLVKNDILSILSAKSLFRIISKNTNNAREKELSLIAFRYTENLLMGSFEVKQDDNPSFEPINIEKMKPKAKKIKKIIIGKSFIKVTRDSKIKTQVDRVTRDWLSAYNISTPPWQFDKNRIVPWHEGKKIKEILDLTDAKVSVVWGTKAKKIDNQWFAPDANGIYRFKISWDKVYNYPTNFIIDNQTVIMNDTHGINAIAWDSLDADLVVGCGDLDGKVQAAYYLASKGVNVYMPTDRFISMLIGVKTKGTIIGSAPVKKTHDGAIIGDQPITININEPIMVTNTTGGYPLQYYDAPYLYFKELERYIGQPLRIMPIEISEYGKADKIVQRAQGIGVKVIGIRVASEGEYKAVSAWLKADKLHRAVLFHSAPYPEGYRLFFEFPRQTTFGDINIRLE